MIQAGAWIARLSLDAADGEAFDAWLAADPANAAAYRRALSLWHEFGARAGDVLAELPDTDLEMPAAPVVTLVPRAARRSVASGWWVGAGGAALAAGLALAVMPNVFTQPTVQTFTTAKGQHQHVALADGTGIDLDAETKISVTMSGSERRVALAEGQAIFDVVHDEKRPFTVHAGGRVVRDVGTQFDVRKRGADVTVTVAKGRVEISSEGGATLSRAIVLDPGQRVEIAPSGAAQMSLVDPAETFAWRAGRLVYRDRPLDEVVADLNRQFVEQTQISDPELGKTPITGVVVLDNPRAVMARLSLMLPIRTVVSDKGLTLLRK
ncbi:FecR family protein [Phenylobacterium sp.]|uniref:FecR family protein n=1 Tax=Phenylobacterium sp. TaxID=1871053 RepID=UPI002E375ABD|nr:FecR domain-containing protein [Phenylobacterium sp.]